MKPDKPKPFPQLNLPDPDPGSNDDLPDEDGPYNEDDRKPIWWYHTDHLGSSTYLTDNFGRPSHYYETLPFGEMMVEHNQSANNGVGYDNKYKFNGKELDDATGMYYYGARYYDPRISIFVSVDPLAEEFVGWTPYHYVHNNPINLIDPTGMSADGWRENLTTGEMTYDESYTFENTPEGYDYSDVNMDDKYVYNIDGSKTMRDEYRDYLNNRPNGPNLMNCHHTATVPNGKKIDLTGGFEGLYINGFGGHNMGGNDLYKYHAINYDDITLFGAGGAEVTGTLKKIQLLSNAFSAMTTLEAEDAKRVKQYAKGLTKDSVYTIQGTERGQGFYRSQVPNKAAANRIKDQYKEKGLINVTIDGKEKK